MNMNSIQVREESQPSQLSRTVYGLGLKINKFSPTESVGTPVKSTTHTHSEYIMNTSIITAPVSIHTINGKQVPAVTSRQVAEAFGKEHKNVIRDIRSILDTDEGEFNALNFELVNYKDVKGEERPMYVMSRDGFVLLGMGFTGAKALAMKVAYITRFNEMEEELRNPSTRLPNFNNPVEAARAWADAKEAEMLAQAQVQVLAPKADTYDNVVADRQCTLTDFARKLSGVNTVAIKRSLLNNDIMYKSANCYKVYSKYRDTYFEEKYDAFRGVTQIIVLDKGKQLLTKLYKERKLIMKGQK